MGIPVYFKTIMSQYQDDILCKTKLDRVNILCFDLNCLIHPCCRSQGQGQEEGLTDEAEMISLILETLDKLLAYTDVTDTVYIAIDGVAPQAKMKQQRQRRHRSVGEAKVWDTNAISPGTTFMAFLNTSLRTWMNKINKSYQIILSDSEEPGEGEHKILHYLKTGPKTKPGPEPKTEPSIVIYGLDADLIMLGLVSELPNVALLRERTEYNIEDTDSEYVYLKIDPLKEFILQDIGIDSKIDASCIIKDYIFLCFLLGNDFMNHCPSLNLRYGGLDTVLDVYRSLQNRYQGHYRLIDTRLPSCIHLPFFKELIQEISSLEPRLKGRIYGQRKKQHDRLKNQYHREYREFETYRKSLKNKNKDKLLMSTITDFLKINSGSAHDKYVKMTENLPILRFTQEQESKSSSEALCQDYLDSLIWTTLYYFKGCSHWKWKTNFHTGPLFRDFSRFLRDIPALSLDQDPEPMTIEEQLEYILPPESYHLHNYTYALGEQKEMKLDTTGCRYLWESSVEFTHELINGI